MIENLTGGGKTPNLPKESVTSVTTTNHETKHVEDSLGNPVVIPGGFKFAGEEGDTVEDGIIIADDEENEFVWIPVSNTDGDNDASNNAADDKDLITKEDGSKVEITLGRYTFANSTQNGKEQLVQTGENHGESSKTTMISNIFYENTNLEDGRPNGGKGAKDLAEFVQSVKNNHGYYIARYEASYKSGDNVENYKPYSKPSTSCSDSSRSDTSRMLWNFITQEDASKVSQNMYSENDSEAEYVVSDLVNSYAWDTAVVYIQVMENENYANAYNGNGSLRNTGVSGDEKCHIFDIAANLREWTTEYCMHTEYGYATPCTVRGGSYYTKFDYVRDRSIGTLNSVLEYVGFRSLLYISK